MNSMPRVLFNILIAISKIFILILIFPFFIVFICPCYILRFFIVAIASKILRPDLVEVLGVRDMFYAVDDITTFPKSSVVVTMVCRGRVTREMLVKNMSQALKKTKPGEKALMYPELKRYLVKWMGFIFWKNDKHFSLENHIVYIDPKDYVKGSDYEKRVIDESVLKQIEKVLVQEAYPEKRSPWCLKILNHYQPREYSSQKSIQDDNSNFYHFDSSSLSEEYSVILFKVHHSFVDGFSMLNLFKEVMQCPIESLYNKPNFPKRSILKNILLNIILFIKAPYDTLSEVMMESDNNPWHLARGKFTNVINSAVSSHISCTKIKDIAVNMQGSFTSVVISAISGGIRRFMVERGEIKCNEDDNTKTFTCLTPFPVQGHPDTLGNYLSDCYLDFPISIADPIRRLKHIENQLNEIKNSTVALSSFIMQPIFGGLFHWMVKPLVEFAMEKSTGVFSSFPGPKVPIYAPNKGEFLEGYFTCGHDSPGIGLQFLALNYNGGWKLKIQADQGTLSSDEEVEQLLSHILHELESYEKIVVV